MLQAGCPSGTVVVARVQTEGRGRMGRSWASAEGGLYMTVVLRPAFGAERFGWVSILGGLATAEGLMALLDDHAAGSMTSRGPTGIATQRQSGVSATKARTMATGVRVKWPNDVLLNGNKVAGVLGEAGVGASGSSVLLGVGVNLSQDPASLPLRPLFPASTVLVETGAAIEPGPAAFRIVQALGKWLDELETRGPGLLSERFTALSAHAGRLIEVHDGDRHVVGRDAGLTEQGALRLDTDRGAVELINGHIAGILDEAPQMR